MEDVIARIEAGLTPAQRRFMVAGKEGWNVDRRVARGLNGKGLMGIAGYVLGFEVYAFTKIGLAVHKRLAAEAAQ